MLRYKFMTLIAMFLYGSSFANDSYFLCSAAKGTINLNESKGVLRYSLIKDSKTEFIYMSKWNDFSAFNTIITRDSRLIISMCHLLIQDIDTQYSAIMKMNMKVGVSVLLT